MKLVLALSAASILLASGACKTGAPQPLVTPSSSPQASAATAVQAPSAMPQVITSADQLDSFVGEIVTIRGPVSDSKVPTILGVDIASDDPDLRGQQAQATGILHRRVVTQEAIDERIAAEGQFAHRGPGTFYWLAGADDPGLAPAKKATD